VQSSPWIAVLKWALVTVAATSAVLTAPFDRTAPHSHPRVGDRSSSVSSYVCAPEPAPLGGRSAVVPGHSPAAAAQLKFCGQLQTIRRRQLRWTP
jgi:hypothetical protein